MYEFDPEFDMEAPTGDELTVFLDDVVVVFEKPQGSDWWFARVNDEFGWVPKNHLEKMQLSYL